jgi:cytochrome c553
VRKGGKRSQATVSAGKKKQKVTKELLADLSDEDFDALANQASCSLTGGGLATSRPSRDIRKTRLFESYDSSSCFADDLE